MGDAKRKKMAAATWQHRSNQARPKFSAEDIDAATSEWTRRSSQQTRAEFDRALAEQPFLMTYIVAPYMRSGGVRKELAQIALDVFMLCIQLMHNASLHWPAVDEETFVRVGFRGAHSDTESLLEPGLLAYLGLRLRTVTGLPRDDQEATVANAIFAIVYCCAEAAAQAPSSH